MLIVNYCHKVFHLEYCSSPRCASELTCFIQLVIFLVNAKPKMNKYEYHNTLNVEYVMPVKPLDTCHKLNVNKAFRRRPSQENSCTGVSF